VLLRGFSVGNKGPLQGSVTRARQVMDFVKLRSLLETIWLGVTTEMGNSRCVLCCDYRGSTSV
jgi:hypothetical protein